MTDYFTLLPSELLQPIIWDAFIDICRSGISRESLQLTVVCKRWYSILIDSNGVILPTTGNEGMIRYLMGVTLRIIFKQIKTSIAPRT